MKSWAKARLRFSIALAGVAVTAAAWAFSMCIHGNDTHFGSSALAQNPRSLFPVESRQELGRLSSEAPASSPDALFISTLAHAEQLPDREERAVARTNALSAWADADPRSAFLHLRNHGSGASDLYLSGVFFRRWAELDFSVAFDCAESQPAGEIREEMFGWLALIVARSNPVEAAIMAERDMAIGPVQSETTISILHQWARVDLARAAAWADSFPQGALRDRALDEIVGHMGDTLPERAPN